MVTRRPRLRILHTSDVHLGAYDASAETHREELHGRFERVIDVGIRERVDMMLIAGDFFDHARVREETLRFAADQVARLERPVVIGPGNHDHVGPGSVYDRLDLPSLAQNLRILRTPEGETAAFDELDVEVWGRSHTEQDPHFRPFEGPPPRGDAAWQLGIGHGHFIHPQALLHHSFHIRAEHLAATERDYIALGHWEISARVEAGERVTAAYSGAPEGLGSKSGGRVLIVDLLEDGTVRLEAHPLTEESPPLQHHEIPYLEAL